MKVILFMSMSVNGFIARGNREEDFLSEDNYQTFVELTNKTGCAVWGRKTHETIRTYGDEAFEQIKDVKKIVISQNSDFQVEDGIELATSPKAALEKLEKYGFKEVILTGGSMLNSFFAKENLIDEIIFNIEAIFPTPISLILFSNFSTYFKAVFSPTSRPSVIIWIKTFVNPLILANFNKA